MPEPVIENIAAALATQLATITTANGYSFDAIVVRPKALVGFDPADKQVVLIQGAREEPEEGTAENRGEHVQPFDIEFHIRPSEDDPTSHDTYLNRYAADIEKALLFDDSTWYAQGRINYQLTGPELLPDQSWMGGGVYFLRVHYRHNYGDPATDGG